MLCQEERELFEQEINPDLVLPESPPAVPEIAVSDVVVTRELASAVIRRPPDNVPAPLYFRRERGMWTVCAPAEDEL
ncbi:MAG: hypothetical protein ACR2JG_06320 [Geodermatophilaceae bacterium]